MASGLYIVTLTNDEPISVNANDPRVADRCIKVNKLHCKFGKAKNLLSRKRNYEKVFGTENVRFQAIVEMEDIAVAEKLILDKLDRHRIRGRRGHRNEWLEDTSPLEVERILLAALKEKGFDFKQVGSVGELTQYAPATAD